MTIIRISHKSCSHTKHMPTGPNGNHRESLISVGAAALHVKLALLHLLFTVNSCTYVSRKHREQSLIWSSSAMHIFHLMNHPLCFLFVVNELATRADRLLHYSRRVITLRA